MQHFYLAVLLMLLSLTARGFRRSLNRPTTAARHPFQYWTRLFGSRGQGSRSTQAGGAAVHEEEGEDDDDDVGDVNESAVSGSRFWSRRYPLPQPDKGSSDSNSSNNIISAMLEQLGSALKDDPDALRVTSGIALLPMPNNKTLIVPIHDGQLQSQHTQVVSLSNRATSGEEGQALLCAFSPRARHVVISPNEEERPTDPERFEALGRALSILGINSPDLLSDGLAGTPPARIYRSFVAPRPGRTHILEPLERAANRTATQIDLAMRQVRADQAVYLRNIDRSMAELEAGGVGEDGTILRKQVFPLVLVLDNIRSAFNVGSLFRTGETAGVAEIITCGITAHPPHPKLRKTAMNSLDVVPTRHFDDTSAAIKSLRSQGYEIVVMETTSKSQVYTQVDFKDKKVALVLGNEVTGVDTRIMDESDMIVEIPTYGVKNSLNVAAAAPIVVFELLRQWTMK